MLIIGWILGMVTLFLVAVASGGWYEYRVLRQFDAVAAISMVENQGWEPVPNIQPWQGIVRRPRLRFPWVGN
jgi:hypothetical protein